MAEYLIQDTTLDAIADAINAKTGGSSAMTPAEMVTEIGSIQTGGGSGGVQAIASGTFTGDGTYSAYIPSGKKMPQTDFILNIWVDNGTEITPSVSTDRSVVIAQAVVQKRFQQYDLSSDGRKNPVSNVIYPTVNTSTGTTTNRSPVLANVTAGFVRQTATASEAMNNLIIIRDVSGFTARVSKNNQYPFVSGITYNWELLYFGNDAANDIVEVA